MSFLFLGFFTGLSLILALGAQNIFVIEQGLKKNYIFIAIKGDRFDGNNYINDAIKNGAKIIISSKFKDQIKNNIIVYKTI